MSGGFWEPWTPKIGQRVRIRLSAECQLQGTPGTPCAEFGPHWPETDGCTGTVYDIDGALDMSQQGHRYGVDFDRRFALPNGSSFTAADHAAFELEPLEDARV